MKVSIITVTYNSSVYISECISSVYNQTHKDIEHIIIDGASSDGTLEIINTMPNRVAAIISEPDKGIYDAMNKGIMIATGEVVGILNSDDFLTSNDVVEKIVERFNSKGVDSVFGDIHFVDPEDLSKTVRYYSSKFFKPYLFRFGFMPAHPSFYVKKSIYQSYGLYELDYKIASDYDLLIRFLYKDRISYSYIPIDFVTMRTGGVSTQSIVSRYVLNKEIVRACRRYGIYTNMFILAFKYIYKVFELKS